MSNATVSRATHSQASPGATCVAGFAYRNATTERTTTGATTATVTYGTTIRKCCAMRPAGDSERRLSIPMYHAAAHTIKTASGIGIESRLAQSQIP